MYHYFHNLITPSVLLLLNGLFFYLTCLSTAVTGDENIAGPTWPLHVIDDSSQGADGVKLADINGDGLMDIATGWEEGGITRVYLHPGYKKAKQQWPAVTVGKTPNVEDTVFVDLDADGSADVVSCCEGKTQTMFVHWAPNQKENLLDPNTWSQAILPASEKRMRWMFAWPMQVDGKRGIDLVAGGKNEGCELGWFQAPADPRKLADYAWHPITPAGWIMSIWKRDMDADGDLDLVISDRYWRPGRLPLARKSWPRTGSVQTVAESIHVPRHRKRNRPKHDAN